MRPRHLFAWLTTFNGVVLAGVVLILYGSSVHAVPVLEAPVILEGESAWVVAPHHFSGGGHPTGGLGGSHYLAETLDAHHFTWFGVDPSTPGIVTIKYDFRDEAGFSNFITFDQKLQASGGLQNWSVATGGRVRFVQDTLAPASDIINIGTGDLLALG